MNKTVVIATKNAGKAKEFKELFSPYGFEVKTLLDLDHLPDIEETGSTFEENAILKAEGIAALTDTFVIADDSGLVIDALDGRPGIYSARYAGEEKNDEANIDKVLDEMKNISQENRQARFYCALAVAGPTIDTKVVAGTCEGEILHKRTGTNGFGYDPIFFVPAQGKAMAELTSEQKNKISHRAKAMKAFEQIIQTIFKKG